MRFPDQHKVPVESACKRVAPVLKERVNEQRHYFSDACKTLLGFTLIYELIIRPVTTLAMLRLGIHWEV